MGAGAFSAGASESESTQVTTTANDQGVVIGRNGNFQASGTNRFGNNAQLASDYNVNKGGTLNITNGVDGDHLDSILGGLSASTGEQISSLGASSAAQLKEFNDSNKSLLASLTDLLAQKSDSENGNPKLLAWVAVAGLAALAFVFWKMKK
jgi:hypothetical protein